MKIFLLECGPHQMNPPPPGCTFTARCNTRGEWRLSTGRLAASFAPLPTPSSPNSTVPSDLSFNSLSLSSLLSLDDFSLDTMRLVVPGASNVGGGGGRRSHHSRRESRDHDVSDDDVLTAERDDPSPMRRARSSSRHVRRRSASPSHSGNSLGRSGRGSGVGSSAPPSVSSSPSAARSLSATIAEASFDPTGTASTILTPVRLFEVEREEGAGPPSIADLAREYAAWEGVPSDTVYAAVSTPSSEAQEEVGSDRWLGETFREATHAPAVGLTTPLQAVEHHVVLLYHRERRLAVDFGTDGGEAHLASGGSSFTSVLLSTRVSNGTMVTTVGAALRSAKMLVLGGNAGLVLSAPHGGRVAPDRVAGRRAPRPRRRQLCRDDQRFVVARDSGTLELALFMRARLRSVSPTTGALSTPHLVVVSLHRRHIDANRPPCLMGPSREDVQNTYIMVFGLNSSEL